MAFQPPPLAKANATKVRDPNMEKLSSNLESRLSAVEGTEEKRVDKVEVIRLTLKKWVNTSFAGQTYTQFMLMLSILSCFEFIYQTYLSEDGSYQSLQIHYFNYVEMGVSGIFGIDWLLAFFIADHKITFVMRYAFVAIFPIDYNLTP